MVKKTPKGRPTRTAENTMQLKQKKKQIV